MEQRKESSDCWTEFTKWNFNSFSQYLTINEKARIFLHSWIPGRLGYYLLVVWRIISAFSLAFFWVYNTYETDKFYGFGAGFKYLSNWGYTLTMISYVLFLVQYGVEFCRRGDA